MIKVISISIIYTLLLFGCSQSKKEKEVSVISEYQKTSSKNIHSEFEKLIVESIDSTIFSNYTIEFTTNSEIDSLDKSHLTFWTLESNVLTEKERHLLKRLIESDKDGETLPISGLVKESLLKSNQESNKLYIQNLNKIVVDSSQNFALTILGTYFTNKNIESRISGWKEIVVFEKVIDNWKISKRLMYVEY